jgi:hypothetical protein
MWYQRQTFQIIKRAIQHIKECAFPKGSCTLRGNTGDDNVSQFAYTSRRNIENKELCDESYAEKIAA